MFSRCARGVTVDICWKHIVECVCERSVGDFVCMGKGYSTFDLHKYMIFSWTF